MGTSQAGLCGVLDVVPLRTLDPAQETHVTIPCTLIRTLITQRRRPCHLLHHPPDVTTTRHIVVGHHIVCHRMLRDGMDRPTLFGRHESTA